MAAFLHRHLRKTIWLLIPALLATGCSSSRPIGTPFPEGYTLESERIVVKTKEGRIVTTRRIEVRDDSLFTDQRAFDLAEIESITEKKFSSEKSYLLLGGVTLAAAGVVVAYVALNYWMRFIVFLH